jgi:predicted PurR-regulated permease PerM
MAGKAEKSGLDQKNIAAYLRRQFFFWMVATLVFVLFLYLFRSILLPFVAGLALAYILDPVADKLERLGLSRLMATVVILIAFLIFFVLALMIIVPVLASQLVDLLGRLPSYVDSIQSLLARFNSTRLEQTIGVSAETIHENLNALITQGAGFLTTLLRQIWDSGKALVDIAALFVVTPVVAFYMLNDWDRMVAQVDDWIPRDHLEDVRQISRDIDRAVAGFVRGQGAVCLVLGLIYAIGLTLIGLNFGLLIGLFAGLISFIPYVGSTVGLVLALGVGLIQFWPDWPMIAGVAVIFFVGQFIEGNILQPKLVGNRVGLHPVWLMFALFAFGSLLGFVGMMVAVPCAAAVGVLVRFAIDKYLKSPLYKGQSSPDD